MSSACQSSAVCAIPPVQIHPAYSNLYKWAESDAEFVRSLAAAGGRTAINNINTRRSGPNPAPVVDSYSCRQVFLRSYTFSKKETVPQKTAKCFRKVKETAADRLPCIHRPTSSGGENSARFSMLSRGEAHHKNKKGPNSRKGRGRSLFLRTFHRLLSCVSSFDVADGVSVVHAL